MKFDFRKIFLKISILFLSFMIGFYGSRFIYFYKTENKKETKEYRVFEYFTKGENAIKNNLIEYENNYYFYKNNKNNYIYYSGLLYRILYLNKDSVYIITDECITNLKYGKDEKYNTSNIKDWLNNVYMNNINKTYLKNNNVNLLDIDIYSKIGQEKSFIKNKDFWILDNDKALVITEVGIITKTSNYSDFLGVRPVIELKANTKIIEGDGSISNPIIIEKRNIKTLNDLYIGEYINYKNNNYRIIEKKDEYIKVLSVNKLNEQKIFSNYINEYSLKYKNDLGYYLNNTYIKELDENDLVKIDYYIGEYNLDYKETDSKKIKTHIGLLKVGDYFISSIKNSFILTTTNDNIYTINKNGSLYIENINKKMDIYPVFALKNNIIVKSGTGQKNNPYTVGD